MVDYKDSPYESKEKYGVGNYFDMVDTLRIIKEEIRSCKVDIDRIMHTQGKLADVNAVILQSFSYW